MKVSKCHGGFIRVSTHEMTHLDLTLAARSSDVNDFTASCTAWDGPGGRSEGEGEWEWTWVWVLSDFIDIQPVCRDSLTHSSDCLSWNSSLVNLRRVGRMSCYFIVSHFILPITYVTGEQMVSPPIQNLKLTLYLYISNNDAGSFHNTLHAILCLSWCSMMSTPGTCSVLVANILTVRASSCSLQSITQ